MAGKKDKLNLDALSADVHALTEAFWIFRETMITTLATQEAEAQSNELAVIDRIDNVPEPDIEAASRLMSGLSHPQRLRIVLMMTRGPVSATDVVDQLGLNTTGAAYHHLNVLTSHGIITQPERGIFRLMPEISPRLNPLLFGLFGLEPDIDLPGESLAPDEVVKPRKKKKKKDANQAALQRE